MYVNELGQEVDVEGNVLKAKEDSDKEGGEEEEGEEEAEEEEKPQEQRTSPRSKNSPKDVEKMEITSPEEKTPVKDQEPKRITRTSLSPRITTSQPSVPEAFPAIVADFSHLEKLLSQVVSQTIGFNVDQCERLLSALGQYVFQHRKNHDKTQLIQDLQAAIDHFCK
ncbi:hypothetical protein CAPTEDRAFT_20102 [Capitella teleta]|uniref:Uncharacterized protein n=1 Tax=Capitella teleta TaxID=283909 RepID=R7VE49_CAPTE|nr:hypothetical protein CAPTEDRAFT_20102 [Capitella teleta]|eukprot:ELU14576.1 hypothetical protein CAPTEDRAFT_20102 [Capitella teleta]